ncbi:hypothetical protein [Streptomyces sp. HUAS TT7]|uniref:hypothetical protein n=1 Tax=Streptomyces sp. HUAS TT7 TaxID=3447507 RepID=UPI003F65EFD2
MSHAWTRRVATVATSAALLTGAAGAAASAVSAAPQDTQVAHEYKGDGDHGKHKGEKNKGDHGLHRHLGWDVAVDKKADRWDAKHHVWLRWDAETHSYAQWDAHTHSWKRHHNGVWQRWDAKHHTWKHGK